MIDQIDVENFGLFQNTRLTFGSGFNVLTGESGSGKSLALESIVTLFGSRLATDRIGRWGDRFHLRATLKLTPSDQRWQPLSDVGIEPDEVLLLERTSGRDGRSWYRAQGQLVPAQVVRTLGDTLIQYTGQHQLLKVADAHYLVDWIDRYGRLQELKRTVEERYRSWREIQSAHRQMEEQEKDLGLLEEKRQLWNELQGFSLFPGEDERIQQELQKLRAGRKLIETSQNLHQLLDGTGERDGLLADFAKARGFMEVLEGYDTDWGTLADSMREGEKMLGEVRSELTYWTERINLDPMRLEQLEVRADTIARLKRRFGPELQDILTYIETLRRDIERLDNIDWERIQLQKRMTEVFQQFTIEAEALSRARRDLIESAAAELTLRIQEMEMPSGRIVIDMRPAVMSARGQDELQLQFSPSSGQDLKPLSKVASGGELARVALALAVTETWGDPVVYVYDEVDQGLGGISAERVGALLEQLGQRAQVLAVSHQPVVAARARQHVGITKDLDAVEAARSTAQLLDGSARVREVARMLSGTSDAVALRHAESLLRGRSNHSAALNPKP